MKRPDVKNRHLLTILVEDYFHVGAFEKLIQQRNWSNFEPRYEQNTQKALDLLDEFDTKATFFVLGWIAEQNPKLIREIVSRGHEVASRGYYHRSLNNLTDEEFRGDLHRANRAIEDAGGQKVIGYRAAEKISYYDKDWIFDILADEGFAYDSSFLPRRNDDRNKRSAHQITTENGKIWEFPYSTRNIGIGLMPISGGNYFRQIPYTLMRHAVREWHSTHDDPFVSYFHVWELDPDQPRISAASSYNRIRHYRKLDKMEWIIRENLGLYECVSIAEHLGLSETVSALKPAAPIDLDLPAPKPVEPRHTEAVTIVIPCYNEQETLPYLANTLRSVEQKLKEHGYEPKLIFVDDCSTDGTEEKLRELFGDWANVRFVRHEQNAGVAAGIMTGISEADTTIVCSMDCDCTYDPHELVKMLPLINGGVDMVTASPYHKDGGVRNVPSWRLFLSKGASFLYRRVLHSKLNTYTSCFRVYRRDSLLGLNLHEAGFLGVAEMLGKLDLRGGRIVEFPSILEVRLFGISKMKTVSTIFGHIRLLSHLSKVRWFRKYEAIEPSIQLEEK
jgi:polysaccharide deacetylase family protein (PEP-CTERM system associated)